MRQTESKIIRSVAVITAVFFASLLSGCSAGRSVGTPPPRHAALVAAGMHHNFVRWWHEEDAPILSASSERPLLQIKQPDDIGEHLDNIDVLFLANNAPFKNPDHRRKISRIADHGGGFLILHAALWHNWKDWPEYNRVLCGGGSRNHDKLGDFNVKVEASAHPLMQGIPNSFTIRDELYWYDPDPAGTPIEVLASAFSPKSGRRHPVVFIVKHPRARIVGISLGHDGSSHQNPVYKRLIENAARWVASSR